MFEIEEIKNINNLADTTRIFNNTWSSRYPRPTRIIIDNGSEFQYDFKHLYTFDIKQKTYNSKNFTSRCSFRTFPASGFKYA